MAECEVPKINATSDEITRLLASARTIAVVGISRKPERPSHWIAGYLRDNGYRVIGVNPALPELFGEKVYPSLSAVPEAVDLVDIFRRPEHVPPVVDEAIAKKVKAIWMQEGIVNNAAAEKARAAGITVIMNKCIYKEHAAR
jgi:predicted CoA-binding protein